MQLSVPRAILLQHVQRCQNVVEKRSTNPILCNLLIRAESGQLQLEATDLQLGVASRTAADVSEEGQTTVSARKLFDIIKELDDEHPVQFSTQDAFLEISSGSYKSRLATLPAEEYPGIPQDDTEISFEVEASSLGGMIAGTAFAMSNDETRKYLTGTLFEADPASGFRLVATDGHRLSMMESALQGISSASQCIVPRKAVLEMRKMAEDHTGPVKLSLGRRQVRLMAGDHLLTSKVIDAQFPAYQDVIPQGNPRTAIVDRMRLDQVLRRSMIVANEFTHDVRLTFAANQLQVMAHNTEQEQAEETVEAGYDGPEVVIGFNGRYLRDVLSVVQAEKVHVHFRDELSPVLIQEVENADAKYVVMPMRI
jgi:DNA polymerase-3 subunit beta